MKKTVKYLLFSFLGLLLLPLILLIVLSIPSVAHYGVTKALTYFLEVNASVTTATLDWSGFKSSGALNHTDIYKIEVDFNDLSSATVYLHYEGDVNTFSKVATVDLPYVQTILDAKFDTNTLYIEANASLLKGTLEAGLSLESMDYHYKVHHVDLKAFAMQQHPAIANYATGQLSVEGSGIITAPYSVSFDLSSQALQLEKNITTQISPKLSNTLPLKLNVRGTVSSEDLNTTLTLHSALLNVNLSTLFYDFNQSTIQIVMALHNHDQKIVPVKEVLANANLSLGDELNASYYLSVDGYDLETKHLQYDLNSSKLVLDYSISSKSDKPINLQQANTLFGTVLFQNSTLRVKLDSKSINSPILLTLKEDKLHIISNNINLEALQDIGNQERIAKGHLLFEADANLSSEPLLWSTKLVSKDLQLPWKYRKDLGLKNTLAFTIKAQNERSGDIVVRPTLWSNIGRIHYTALRYKPEQQLLFFNINAKKIKTTYYQAPKLNLKGAFNLKKSRLNKTTLTTPYEKVVVKRVTYSDKEVYGYVDFALTRLDRFASLNRDYTLTGKTYLHYTPKKTTLSLDSQELGALSLEHKGEVIKLSGHGLRVEELMTLSDQLVVMKGDLKYDLRYSASSIKAEITSDKLIGYGDLNSSIRPFSLNYTTSLKYKKKRYRGQATLKTDNELIKITNVVVDLSKNKIKSKYKLEIDKLEKNTFILPKELKGPLHVNGDFEQDKYQHLTFNLKDFQLPLQWHKLLESNATSYLETNTSLALYNDKGLISFDATIDNTLLNLYVNKSDYNLKTGDFHLSSVLKTGLWLKDTNITAEGRYNKTALSLPKVKVTTTHQAIDLTDTHYTFKDQNFTTAYQLSLTPYANAPYHTETSLYGTVATKPELYATLKSNSLGGTLNASVTNTKIDLLAQDVSLVKLLAFSGEDIPISEGLLNAKVDVRSDHLLDGNLSTLKGKSDLNITDMTLNGVELDSILDKLRKSQDLNLFQGSLSDLPIVRSVKEIPSDIRSKDVNSTHFKTIRFLTDINSTGIHCKDCAIATDKNLIAIHGGINLTSQTFDDFYIGLLFPTNCAYFIQQVDGNLSAPKVKLAAAGFKVVGGATMSLLSNVGTVVDFGADVIKDTGEVVGTTASYVPVVGKTTDKALTSITDAPKSGTESMTECTPFYTGSVHHPKAQ